MPDDWPEHRHGQRPARAQREGHSAQAEALHGDTQCGQHHFARSIHEIAKIRVFPRGL